MNKKSFLIVAAVLFPLSIYAGEKSAAQETFNKLDQNQDGYISQNEAKADKRLSDDWSKADTNKDGKIEKSEFSAFEESMESGGMPSKGSEEESNSPD